MSDAFSLANEREFPLTDFQFAEAGGTIWTPRELSEQYLQDTIDLYNWRLKNKCSQHGDKKKLKALVDEKYRRELMKHTKTDSTQSNELAQAPNTELLPDELVVTFTDAAGRVWGECIATPRTFNSGSVGYFASDKVKKSGSRTKYQVAVNLVEIGSRPKI